MDSKLRAKVTDFGISYRIGIKGTPFWMAPEILRDESDLTVASDVYSFGITLYEIYARKVPYEDEEEDRDLILREICDPVVNRRPTVPTTMPNRVAALIHDCLVANPSERPTMDEIASRIRRFTSRDVAPMKPRGNHSDDDESRIFQDLLKRFPRHIAEDLRDGRQVSPQNHECATIFVANVVGFDKIASELSQQDAFNLICRWQDSLNKLAQSKQVFKIETTGETWMGVTNCATDQSETHVKVMAEFALAAVELAGRTLADPDQPELGFVQICVGFHSGPLLTNVIGTSPQNARFTLFGETVNAAIRIAHNKPGLVICSSESAALLSKQAPDTLESSPCDRNRSLYWVCVKGLRASAAYDRIRQKQKDRMMKNSGSCASSWTSIDSIALASVDGGFAEASTNNEDCSGGGEAPSCQVDFGEAKDELFPELGMEMGIDNEEDDDDMTDLRGSLKERLARSHRGLAKVQGQETRHLQTS